MSSPTVLRKGGCPNIIHDKLGQRSTQNTTMEGKTEWEANR